MFEKELNNKLITAIYRKFPHDINIIDVLSEILQIGKDSVYRRLRGNVYFTFKDIIQLSLALNISIDEIINIKDPENILLDLNLLNESEAISRYIKKIEDYVNTISLMRENSSGLRTFAVYDSLPEVTVLNHQNIFKFYLYKWLYQVNQFTPPIPMSKFVMPSDAILYKEKCVSEIKKISASTLIFDRNVYLSCIKEISYFYKRKLLSKDEIYLLKEELLRSIAAMEKIATEGKTAEGTIVKIYLSSVDVGASYAYYETENNVFCQYPVFTIFSLETQNPELSQIQKDWIESFKKYSICISEASEIERYEYYEKQREFVNSLDSVLS